LNLSKEYSFTANRCFEKTFSKDSNQSNHFIEHSFSFSTISLIPPREIFNILKQIAEEKVQKREVTDSIFQRSKIREAAALTRIY